MTCATCAKTIENTLLRLDGIIEINIDLAGEKAIVIYNPNIVTQANMRRTIEEAGYQFLGIEGEKTEDFEKVAREKDLKEKTYYFCAPGCKKEFDDNPEKYIEKAEKHQPPMYGCC